MAYMSNDERREQLLAAASKVIREQGLAKATTRRITDTAGAPVGTLYYCFRGKEDLLGAVTRRLGSGGHVLSRSRIIPGMGVAEAAAAILDAFGEWLAEPEAKTLSEYEIYIWANLHDDYREMPTQVYGEWTDNLQTLLTAAERADDPPRDTRAIAQLLLALIDGYNLQGQLLGEDLMLTNSKRLSRIIGLAVDNGEFDLPAAKTTARPRREGNAKRRT
jgi:TetR/AcrR family transcriptional regulator, regulator of biofilm formation and stress response